MKHNYPFGDESILNRGYVQDAEGQTGLTWICSEYGATLRLTYAEHHLITRENDFTCSFVDVANPESSLTAHPDIEEGDRL